MVTLIFPPPQCIHRLTIIMTLKGGEAKFKWNRLSHLAPNKFKAHARTEHELVSSLDPVQHPNHLTNFPSRHNYIINYKC